MRKIIISFCILFAALSLQAQSVNGIRIDGGNTPILVYLGGNQICLPTTTCFIANLNPGHYTVEVFATRFTRAGERVWKGEKLCFGIRKKPKPKPQIKTTVPKTFKAKEPPPKWQPNFR